MDRNFNLELVISNDFYGECSFWDLCYIMRSLWKYNKINSPDGINNSNDDDDDDDDNDIANIYWVLTCPRHWYKGFIYIH